MTFCVLGARLSLIHTTSVISSPPSHPTNHKQTFSSVPKHFESSFNIMTEMMKMGPVHSSLLIRFSHYISAAFFQKYWLDISNNRICSWLIEHTHCFRTVDDGDATRWVVQIAEVLFRISRRLKPRLAIFWRTGRYHRTYKKSDPKRSTQASRPHV